MRVEIVDLQRAGRDAMAVASDYAKLRGLRLDANMRWRGAIGPAYREIAGTKPGLYVEIRIWD